MSLSKWKLLSKQDISVTPWFPMENRTYELPNGKIIDDFSVTTIANVAMVVPVSPENKILVVHQFKPGVDELTLEFPAGRLEGRHKDILELAHEELLEETGGVAGEWHELGSVWPMPTKGTEEVYCFLATGVKISSKQHLDITEEIEVLSFTPAEIDDLILTGKLKGASSICAWTLAKAKFPQIFAL